MGDHNKVLPRPIFRRDISWDPFPNWTQPSRLFAQDFGLPPFLEPNDLTWIDWAKRRLASHTWPGFAQSPLLVPFNAPSPAVLQGKLCGEPEVRMGQGSWKINLDVNHFSPEEITITTKEGYLEISGNHEETQDEHGSVARCFTRKYKLPQGVDLQHISAGLSGDGILSVEAPIPGTVAVSQPFEELVIPVQMKHEEGESDQKVSLVP
ncbi:heat shock protein beta-1-like [Aplochiton taeniatus]